MKKITISLLLLTSTLFTNAQWTMIHQDSIFIEVLDLYFFNKDTGLVCGQISHGEGFVLRTTNGGESWSNTQSDIMACSSIDFINDQIGFTGGQDGVVYKSQDGGISWEYYSTSAFTQDFDEIIFLNDSVGFIKSYHGNIYKTRDSGHSWEVIDKIQDHGYFSDRKTNPFHFLTDSIGFAVGNGVFKTTDQGDSWCKMDADTVNYYRSIYMIDNIEGFAVGNDGFLLHSIDGGNVWDQTQISDQDLRDIYFVDDQTGFAIGGGFDYTNDTIGIVLSTTDRGATWNSHPISNTRLNSFQYIDSVAYITGNYGKIYKNENITLSLDEKLTDRDKINIFPNPAKSYVYIKTDLETAEIFDVYLFNLKGQLVKQIQTENNMISLLETDSGIYILKVYSHDKFYIKKLIIN